MMSTLPVTVQLAPRLVKRGADGFEQIVMGEVLIPNTPNTYGDIYTEEAIRDFATQYMIAGLNTNVILDVEHDLDDVTGDAYIVESFVARDGDPNFIKGSWVVAVWIKDETLWQMVLDNKINGFSYEALVGMQPVGIENLRSRIITGTTAPDLLDGHTHTYCVIVDALNRPVSGSTGDTDGHSHTISTHTTTDEANGHKHRFDVINDDGEN
jgi:hypothetical protein